MNNKKKVLVKDGVVVQVWNKGTFNEKKYSNLDGELFDAPDEVVSGYIYSEGSFVQPKFVKTKEEYIAEIDQKTSSKIFSVYSDNKQKNITRLALVEMQKALKGEEVNQEIIKMANDLNDFVEKTLAEGRAEKDKIT